MMSRPRGFGVSVPRPSYHRDDAQLAPLAKLGVGETLPDNMATMSTVQNAFPIATSRGPTTLQMSDEAGVCGKDSQESFPPLSDGGLAANTTESVTALPQLIPRREIISCWGWLFGRTCVCKCGLRAVWRQNLQCDFS